MRKSDSKIYDTQNVYGKKWKLRRAHKPKSHCAKHMYLDERITERERETSETDTQSTANGTCYASMSILLANSKMQITI